MDDAIRLLASSSLFGDLDESVLQLLAEDAFVREVEAGETLFEPGDARNDMYLVIAGRLEIRSRELREAGEIVLLGPGECVGEAGLLEPSVHTGAATANHRATLLQVPLLPARERLAADGKAAIAVCTAVAHLLVWRLKYASFRRAGWDRIYGIGTTRTEHDLLGEREVPQDARYGVQTLRAVENFPITGIRVAHFPALIRALACVKQAAARANRELGLLPEEVAGAIELACQEIIEGHWHGHFVVDVVQGGAGTSTNMNANEVIANRALEILGHSRGAYQHCHPNNHVNLSQSTNDAYPTAVNIAAFFEQQSLGVALEILVVALREKAEEFDDVLKMGRTQLQDAVPMTLGQEFEAVAVTVEEDIVRLREAAKLLLEVNLGGTAIGTGLNAHPDYRTLALAELRDLTGLPLVSARDLIEATNDTGAFVHFSGVLKRIAVKISKFCNDLRLLSSGPRCGIGEIHLPPMQPGSSIMPGKVNPVIPEVVNQVAYQVIGNDLTITMAAEAGQLQLNVMEPVIAFNLFESLSMMTAAVRTLTERCIEGIAADRDRCRELVERSIGVVTALVPVLGYDRASAIAKEALDAGLSVREILLRDGDIGEARIDESLAPERMV